jgi:hypothetical protein
MDALTEAERFLRSDALSGAPSNLGKSRLAHDRAEIMFLLDTIKRLITEGTAPRSKG